MTVPPVWAADTVPPKVAVPEEGSRFIAIVEFEE